MLWDVKAVPKRKAQESAGKTSTVPEGSISHEKNSVLFFYSQSAMELWYQRFLSASNLLVSASRSGSPSLSIEGGGTVAVVDGGGTALAGADLGGPDRLERSPRRSRRPSSMSIG